MSEDKALEMTLGRELSIDEKLAIAVEIGRDPFLSIEEAAHRAGIL